MALLFEHVFDILVIEICVTVYGIMSKLNKNKFTLFCRLIRIQSYTLPITFRLGQICGCRKKGILGQVILQCVYDW